MGEGGLTARERRGARVGCHSQTRVQAGRWAHPHLGSEGNRTPGRCASLAPGLVLGVVAASDPSLRVPNVECTTVRAVASRLLVDPNARCADQLWIRNWIRFGFKFLKRPRAPAINASSDTRRACCVRHAHAKARALSHKLSTLSERAGGEPQNLELVGVDKKRTSIL